MKQIIIIFTFLIFTSISAQSNTETEQVKETINNFFEAFHNQDSTAMRSLIHKEIYLQSIGKNRAGTVQLQTDNVLAFLKAIVSIPKNQSFKEKIISYDIKIDGNMANVWTDYEFWFNNQLSHCGVNSFQLIKEQNAWKIFYIVDTRRQNGCND